MGGASRSDKRSTYLIQRVGPFKWTSKEAKGDSIMVIMEGDPSPGAIRGRMSFQSFNPSIDKLNEEASNPRQSEGDATPSGDQGGKLFNRENEESVRWKDETSNSNKANGDLKRKQVEEVHFPNKSPNTVEGNQSSSKNSRKNSHKPPKRGKLDFNVLRSPNSQSKRD
ncbi:M-phase phosphoprotein 6 [Tanacetum coccineum]